MFVVTVTFEIDPTQMSEFLPLMLENARLSLELEEGCRQFDVCESTERPNEIFLYEVYDSVSAFDEHLKAQHYLGFAKATDAMVLNKSVQKHALIQP